VLHPIVAKLKNAQLGQAANAVGKAVAPNARYNECFKVLKDIQIAWQLFKALVSPIEIEIEHANSQGSTTRSGQALKDSFHCC
tara:strand:- start:6994 stop:7242 length:249 start_codon:yes stop_codon:yes gene_type:complete